MPDALTIFTLFRAAAASAAIPSRWVVSRLIVLIQVEESGTFHGRCCPNTPIGHPSIDQILTFPSVPEVNSYMVLLFIVTNAIDGLLRCTRSVSPRTPYSTLMILPLWASHRFRSLIGARATGGGFGRCLLPKATGYLRLIKAISHTLTYDDEYIGFRWLVTALCYLDVAPRVPGEQ